MYVGHNVYGPRASDYGVRTGMLDRRERDFFCDACWWKLFGDDAFSAAQSNELTQYCIRKDPNSAYGGAHGALGFYWWPNSMSAGTTCANCGGPAKDLTDSERDHARQLIASALLPTNENPGGNEHDEPNADQLPAAG